MAIGDVTTNIVTLSTFRAAKFKTDDSIAIAGVLSAGLTTTSRSTIVCKIMVHDTTPAANKNIFSFGDTSANEFVDIFLRSSGNLRARGYVAGVAQWVLETDNPPLSNNTIHTIALKHNGTQPKIVVDGIKVDQSFIISTDKTKWFNDMTNLDNAYIGSHSVNSAGLTQFWDGMIGDFRIYYNSVSTADLLLDHGGMTYKEDLAHHYKFDGDYTDSVGTVDGTNSGTWLGNFDSPIAIKVVEARNNASDTWLLTGSKSDFVTISNIQEA